jgi:hypothetical protein
MRLPKAPIVQHPARLYLLGPTRGLVSGCHANRKMGLKAPVRRGDTDTDHPGPASPSPHLTHPVRFPSDHFATWSQPSFRSLLCIFFFPPFSDLQAAARYCRGVAYAAPVCLGPGQCVALQLVPQVGQLERAKNVPLRIRLCAAALPISHFLF